MCLTGILKNILLVIMSVIIWSTAITPLQYIGYGVACVGLVVYSLGWEQMVNQSAAGWTYARRMWEGSDNGGRGGTSSLSSPRTRRVVFIGLTLATAGFLWMGFDYAQGAVEEGVAVTKI